MNHNPLLSLITESFDHMFVVDKRGKTIFFPWGSNKQGYFIKSQSTVTKAKKFYRSSLVICFIVLGITISFFHDFWAIISSMVILLGGWYCLYYLYTSKITKYLPPTKTSYKDVVLEKLESQETEEEISSGIQFPKQWNNPRSQIKADRFAGIKRIWYRLTPAQLFMGLFFIGIFIFLIWSTYHHQKFGETPEDYLMAFFVSFLWGLSGFVITKNMESAKADLWGFLNWKLPMILMMIVFWFLALLSLYKYIVMKII